MTGPSNSSRSVFLTNLVLNIFNEYDKIYIYSTSLHQDLYQKVVKCFGKYIPIPIIPYILIEEDIDAVVEEIVNNEDFEKSDIEKEANESIDEIKQPQEYDSNQPIVITLDDLNEKEINNPKKSYV